MMNMPKYMWVKGRIQEEILDEDILVGEKIPSEAELTKQFSVSRHTIRQAIAELENDGFLIKRQGSGTYVSDGYMNNPDTASNTIGVITTYVSDYIFPSIIRGMRMELSKHNYSLMLSSTHNNVDNEKRSLERMSKQNVKGLIVEPTKSNLLNLNLNYYMKILQRKVPLIMLHAKYDELDVPVIGMNDEKAGYIATEYLIELGHEKIAMITKTDDQQGKKRLKGFMEALGENNLTFESEHILTFNTEGQQQLYENIQKLLDSSSVPTAFVCYNDQIAIMLIQEMRAMGKKVPEDFSVVSHDDSYLSTTLPSLDLTSVVHPKEAMGKEAARWLINAIEKRSSKKESVIFQPKLKIGNSVRALTPETKTIPKDH